MKKEIFLLRNITQHVTNFTIKIPLSKSRVTFWVSVKNFNDGQVTSDKYKKRKNKMTGSDTEGSPNHVLTPGRARRLVARLQMQKVL